MIETFIYITTETEMIHAYKNAPDEVWYLRYPHRHMAKIKIKIQVYHNDREIEFIMFKHKINHYLESNNLTTSQNKSCEMIANDLLTFIQDTYGKERKLTITVSEDNENGCELIYHP